MKKVRIAYFISVFMMWIMIFIAPASWSQWLEVHNVVLMILLLYQAPAMAVVGTGVIFLCVFLVCIPLAVMLSVVEGKNYFEDFPFIG